MKECRVCGETKPLDHFRPGHRRCKSCKAEYQRAYRIARWETVREKERQWYIANRDAKREYIARYREVNRDQILPKRRQWYEENRAAEVERSRRRYEAESDRFRKRSREWTRAHPEYNVARASQRRASLPLSDRETRDYIAVLRQDPCSYCGNSAGTIDHIDPLSSGGLGGWENLTASCRPCNSSKGTTALLAFLRQGPK